METLIDDDDLYYSYTLNKVYKLNEDQQKHKTFRLNEILNDSISIRSNSLCWP